MVLGGLAVDKKFRAAAMQFVRQLIRYLGAQAVALLADNEQQSDRDILFAQALGSGNLRANYALGVAGAAPVNIFIIFRRWEKWRDNIHVSGKYNFWMRHSCRLLGRKRINIEALTLYGDLASRIAQRVQLAQQQLAHRAFVAADGLHINEPASEREQVHAASIALGFPSRRVASSTAT